MAKMAIVLKLKLDPEQEVLPFQRILLETQLYY